MLKKTLYWKTIRTADQSPFGESSQLYVTKEVNGYFIWLDTPEYFRLLAYSLISSRAIELGVDLGRRPLDELLKLGLEQQ